VGSFLNFEFKNSLVGNTVMFEIPFLMAIYVTELLLQ
jgi:hypothetical protein